MMGQQMASIQTMNTYESEKRCSEVGEMFTASVKNRTWVTTSNYGYTCLPRH